MNLSEKKKEDILTEIARLSMIIYNGETANTCMDLAMIINHLTAVLLDMLSISGFHEEIAMLPPKVREFYYELLFE